MRLSNARIANAEAALAKRASEYVVPTWIWRNVLIVMLALAVFIPCWFPVELFVRCLPTSPMRRAHH